MKNLANQLIPVSKVYSKPLILKIGDYLNYNLFKEILKKYRITQTKSILNVSSFSYDDKNEIFTIKISKNKLVKIELKEKKITNIEINNKKAYQFKYKPLFLSTITNNNYNDYENHHIDKYPKELIEILLLVEDSQFYKHKGIDFFAIYQALYDYFFNNKALRGASTITQQIIKNTLLSSERTLKRKITEAIMALWLETYVDKSFILQRYLNTVYLGQDGKRAIYGFENASWYYFNNSINDLSIEQISLLVGMAKGPSVYNPYRTKKLAKKRRDTILLILYKNKKN